MTKNDKVKRFDCIEMKTNIQRQIYNETKDMTVKELLRYFNGHGERKPRLGKGHFLNGN